MPIMANKSSMATGVMQFALHKGVRYAQAKKD